mgnify:CR=1 FL=1
MFASLSKKSIWLNLLIAILIVAGLILLFFNSLDFFTRHGEEVNVPSVTGKSFEEFADIMKENAQKDFKKYVSKHNHPNLSCEILVDDERNPGEQIIDYAQKIGGDMLLLGSRGRTSSAAVILGSTAEKLIHSNKVLPMLIFKRKGETMGFFDALFKI